ncbi:hypothetical protein Ancab_032808 [Ancistrocladus abbreviatus]
MAKPLLPFTVVFFLLFAATSSRLDFPANEVKRDVIDRLTVVSKGGLPDFPAKKRPFNNILLPTDAKFEESDDSIRVEVDVDAATDKNRVTEEEGTVSSVIEDKEPDFSGGDHERLVEDPILSNNFEVEKPDFEEKAQQEFRSTRPLNVVNLRPMSRFRPINRRFDDNDMRRAFPLFRLPHRCRHHHQIRRQIPVQQRFDPRFRPQRVMFQDRDNMAVLKKDGFLSWREIPARKVDQPAFFRDMTTEFPERGHHQEEGLMIGEFKQPRWFFHRRHGHHHHHHHHDHDHDHDRDEVEEKEAWGGREREEREDDGVFTKIRKFLSHF